QGFAAAGFGRQRRSGPARPPGGPAPARPWRGRTAQRGTRMTAGTPGGAGVLVTRPDGRAVELSQAIADAGGSVVAFAVLEIETRDETILHDEQARLPAPDIAIFVSTNAVRFGLRFIPASGVKIAAIGPTTRACIEAEGRTVDIYPASGFDSEHLLQEPDLKDVDGKNVRIVRADSVRELIATVLKER